MSWKPLSVAREEVAMLQYNLINPQDRNYLNIPLSIINQRWYKSEKAVRAWFFMAWQSLLPHWDEHKTKVIKGKTFNLTEGEMICTRSYLAKSLGITDAAAKGNTDKLKRTNTIKVKQEILSKDIVKAPKNKLSRITVDGVPVPNEPYLKTVIPVENNYMWRTVGLAQLYIYIMCRAEHKETYAIGVGGAAVQLKAGDFIISYKELMEALRCKEGNLKKNLKTLESVGAITRQRLGNQGILIHLNYYPECKHAEVKEEVKNTKVEELLELTTKPAKCQSFNNNKVIDKVTEPTKKVVSKQPQTVVSPTPSQNTEIHDTPVTDAIKYLFYDLKHNKDIGHLNQVIDYVNDNLPAGFPMEKLNEAMDAYFDEHGEKYIEKITVVKSINKFFNKYKSHQEVLKENDSKIDELYQERDELKKRFKEFIDNWKLTGKAYKINFTQDGNISTLSESEVQSIYYTLWLANNRSEYINPDSLKYIKGKVHPTAWESLTCKRADYIEEFFSRFENYEALGVMYRQEYQIMYDDYIAKMAGLKDKFHRLKPAV